MIRNIWAVGRNYRDHAKEMGADLPEKPLVFLKAGSTSTTLRDVPLFTGSKDIHHEIEIALRFGSVPDSSGHLLFDGAAIALDLTARDLQSEAKAGGLPWTSAKSFPHSCPISGMMAVSGDVPHFQFELEVNGEPRQKGDTRNMIFDFETLRVYVQKNFPVEPGDLLLTGTPQGVAALKPGDTATARLESSTQQRIRMEWIFR